MSEVYPIVQTIFRAESVRVGASWDIFVLSPLRIAPSSPVDRRWWSRAQRLMASFLVVTHHVTSPPWACVVDAWVVGHIPLLLLHRTPSPRDQPVIQRSAATIPTEPEASWLPPCRARLTGDLGPLVRREQLGVPVPERLLQRLDTTRQGPGHRQGPRPPIAAAPVPHGDQGDPPRVEADRGALRAPPLSAPVDRDAAQQRRGTRVSGRRLAEPWLGVERFPPPLPQPPTDPWVIDRLALALQPGRHPPYPLKRRGGVRRVQHSHAPQMLGAFPQRLVVERRAREPSPCALPSETPRRGGRFDPRPLLLNGQDRLVCSSRPTRPSAAPSAGRAPPGALPPPSAWSPAGWTIAGAARLRRPASPASSAAEGPHRRQPFHEAYVPHGAPPGPPAP
jgi:hypothetical protein